MATTQTIQIKRSSTTAAPSTSLAAGELAYSSNSDKLFIGHPDGSTGNIVIASTAPMTLGADSGSDVTINIQDLMEVNGDTGITTSISKTGTTATVLVDLDDTAVTPGSYGSSTSIPTFTVDQQGRLTAAGSAAITTTLTIQSDDAVDNAVALATDKLKILGGTGLTTSNSNDDVTINVDTGGISNTMLANDSAFLGSTELELGNGTGTVSTVDGLNTLHGIDGSGTDIAGTNFTIKAGAGTGAGAGGSILFQTADGAASGTGVNSFATAMTIADDGAVTIAGNLTVNGTTTTVNSNTVEIGDAIMTLNSDETGTPSADAGLEIERGTSTNTKFYWDESAKYWVVGDGDTPAYSRVLTASSWGTAYTGNVDGGTF